MKLCFPVVYPCSDVRIMAMNGDFEHNLSILHQIGYQGIELMIRNAHEISVNYLREKLAHYELELAAIGVTPMVVEDKLTLASAKSSVRKRALERALATVDLAAEFNAPFCIGSFRGFVDKVDDNNNRKCAMNTIRGICKYAESKDISVLIEPQGVASGNYINAIDEGIECIDWIGCSNLKLVLDIFHIAANEYSILESLQKSEGKFGLIHICDSERYMMGFGDIKIRDFIIALHEMGYGGYISTEVRQSPDSETVARMSYQYFDYLQRVVLNKQL